MCNKVPASRCILLEDWSLACIRCLGIKADAYNGVSVACACCVYVNLQELCDLLTGLLETDSSARLSIAKVQATSWFDGFDWKALQDKTLTPPVLPAHVSSVQHS